MATFKQRVFSGVQPSGNLTVGNYLGAIKNWVGLQESHETIFLCAKKNYSVFNDLLRERFFFV